MVPRKNATSAETACWTLAGFLALQTIQLNRGFYDGRALALAVAAFVAALAGLAFAARGSAGRVPSRVWSAVCLGLIAVQGAQSFPGPPLWYLSADRSLLPYWILTATVLVASAAGFAREWLARLCRPVVVAAIVLLSAWTLRASPSPPIDTYVWQQTAAAAFLDGRNPYAGPMPDIYNGKMPYYPAGWVSAGVVRTGLVYPPVTLGLALPGYVLGRDVRWSLAGAAGVILALVVAGGRAAWPQAALLATTPSLLFVLEQSWTDLYVLLGLALTAWSVTRARRAVPIALACLLASKQYAALLLPLLPLLLPRWDRATVRTVGAAAAIAALLTAPLALWDLPAFFRSTVLFHAASPFREDALTLSAFVFRQFGAPLPGAVAWAAYAAALLAALRWMPRTAGGFVAASGIVMLPFFLFAKQAFANYYFVIGWMFYLAAAVRAGETLRGDAPAGPDDR
jgi:hypothetical protein